MGLFNRKPKLQGMTSGSPDVYSKGETRTQDSRYRDVYGEMREKKGNKKGVTSRAYVPVGTGLAMAGTALGVFGVIPFATELLTGIASELGMFSKVYSIVDTAKYLAFGSIFSATLSWGSILGVGLFAHTALSLNWKAQNMNNDHTDINTSTNDSYVQQPLELPANYDVFPDAGAHSSVSPTAVLSHMMLDNKGVKKITVPKLIDGEPVYDDEGHMVMETKDVFDKKFGEDLFTASFIPTKENGGAPLRKFFDPRSILYNPTGARGKANHKTVADLVNNDWYFPTYERQRPAGVYVVDTNPANTMVLAMTRAGKGQTIIEPTIDMWTREKNPHNIAVNDPKGELYSSFYYPASQRGYDVIAFNLINPSRTNIYNPLGYAVEASRQGDNQKVEELVASVGDVFFSTENSDDPMWNNAANAAFKRSALGLIDFYQEEEREMREQARVEGWNQNILDQKLDEMWGRVTLYNVYKMMTELASKKSDDEDFIHLDDDDPSEEKDYLTLFFDATNKLPRNALRTSTANQDDSLRAMADSDKTIASVYGISLTAMLFFADEKISRLTSGRPSQNFDMVGLGFPRRMGVRFDADFMKRMNFQGQRLRFTCYRDKNFTDKYEGDKFTHETRVDSNGWCFAFFEGIFENNKTYIKLEIIDDLTEFVAGVYYFQFTKGYQKSLNGRTYVEHPVHKTRIVRGGTLVEMQRTVETVVDANGKSQKVSSYSIGQTLMKRKRRVLFTDEKLGLKAGDEREDDVPVFIQNEVNYTEEPKAIFFITPPHLMTYAKVILILLNQMFNMQVDKAYLTKANQKPMLKTRYMLDEVGNLQSEGGGIPFLQTKESIGLGQEQQYTLILQTFQQLKDVYGESIEKILQGNTENIIYLKSTDDSMLGTLEGMSGVRKVASKDSKTVTSDVRAFLNKNEGKVSYTTSIKEVPTIEKNDMLFIPPCNAMVFGKGNPIWSRNETALPMAWRLHQTQLRDKDAVPKGERKYPLGTVPTTVNTDQFDVISNKPDFMAMVSKRVTQARKAQEVYDTYKAVHGLNEDGMSRIDPELLSQELMHNINILIAKEKAKGVDKVEEQRQGMEETAQEETAVTKAQAEGQQKIDEWSQATYAGGTLSRSMLVDPLSRTIHRDLDVVIAEAYMESKGHFASDMNYQVGDDDSLYYVNDDNSTTLLIASQKEQLQTMKDTADKGDGSVQHVPHEPHAESVNEYTAGIRFAPTDAMYRHLVELPTWTPIAKGHFEQAMKKANINYINRRKAEEEIGV